MKNRRTGTIPDIEKAKGWATKFSMDYMTMDGLYEETAPAFLVIFDDGDGRIFSHGTVGKGIQGDNYWLARQIAQEVAN